MNQSPGDAAQATSLPEIEGASALGEATPESLDILFARDPESLSRLDRDRIVGALREMRKRFESAEAEGKGARGSKTLVSSRKAPALQAAVRPTLPPSAASLGF